MITLVLQQLVARVDRILGARPFGVICDLAWGCSEYLSWNQGSDTALMLVTCRISALILERPTTSISAGAAVEKHDVLHANGRVL